VNDQLILGYDFGTSAVKVALFNQMGKIVAHSSKSYPMLLPQKGWAEQVPDDWWSAMILATQDLLSSDNIDVSRIKAIGICAQMCGTIPVDIKGNVLHNALIWLDTRSSDIAHRITNGLVRINGYGLSKILQWLWITNGAPNLSGKDPISKILWFKESKTNLWKQTHKFLDVKDYLLFRLTGSYSTTQDCAHVSWLMDSRADKRCWSDTLLKQVGIQKDHLPNIYSASQIVGKLSVSIAKDLGLEPGVTVVGGMGDVGAYAIGSGQIRDNSIHIHCGTGGWIAAHMNRRAVDIFNSVATVCAPEKDRYLLIAAQETAGACVNWAANVLSNTENNQPNFSEFDRLAKESPPGAEGLFFFPWLFGERVPVDNDKIRGGFLNLSLHHSKEHMARSVLEGVALNTRWALNPVEKIVKNNDNIRLLGGGAVSDIWCQIFADVLQRPIEQVFQPEFGGCRGAAMAAAVGCNWFDDFEQASKMVQVQNVFLPNKDLAYLYDQKFDEFKQNFKYTKKWYERINDK